MHEYMKFKNEKIMYYSTSEEILKPVKYKIKT